MSLREGESSCSRDEEDVNNADGIIKFFQVTESEGFDRILSAPYQQSTFENKRRSCRCSLNEISSWRRIKKRLDERRLCQSVSMNDTQSVRHLLRHGVSPKCHDSQMRSPLHLAACKGYTHMVELLLEHGANPNARDAIGNTPLHLASCTNNIGVVNLLLHAGTDACSIDRLGRSPLQLAQSKLKILQKSHDPGHEVKSQVSQVIELLLMFSQKEEMCVNMEMLNRFKNSLELSDTREKVDNQLKDLLESLNSLDISH